MFYIFFAIFIGVILLSYLFPPDRKYKKIEAYVSDAPLFNRTSVSFSGFLSLSLEEFDVYYKDGFLILLRARRKWSTKMSLFQQNYIVMRESTIRNKEVTNLFQNLIVAKEVTRAAVGIIIKGSIVSKSIFEKDFATSGFGIKLEIYDFKEWPSGDNSSVNA